MHKVFQYDKEARALYIKIGTGKVVRSKETSPSFILDYDKNNHIIGIEMLDVGECPNSDKLVVDVKELVKSSR